MNELKSMNDMILVKNHKMKSRTVVWRKTMESLVKWASLSVLYLILHVQYMSKPYEKSNFQIVIHFI